MHIPAIASALELANFGSQKWKTLRRSRRRGESTFDSSGYSEMTKRGYNLLSWTQDGMTCWLVSDVPTSELERFAQLYK